MGIFNRNSQQTALTNEENDIRLKQNASFVGNSNDPFSTPARDNYQTYPYDYFTGTDCKIFFGDIWVDDILAIQYNLSQSKSPIYGYASQTFDAIAKGQIIVQGTLSIQFKETGYLNVIQATLESQRANASEIIKAKIDQYKTANDVKNLKYIPGITSISDDPLGNINEIVYSANGSPQIIRQQQTIEQILTSKKAGAALSKTLNLKNSTRDFEDFAEILEDSIWGDSNGRSIKLDYKLKRPDEFDYNTNGGITTSKSSNGTNYSDTLNIMLTFGDINDFRAEHTIVILNDVHFTGSSMVVTPEGNPVAEEYSFIARNINDSINTKANVINISPIKLNIGTSDKLSTLDDVKKVEEFLDKSNSIVQLKIKAGLGTTGWESKDILLQRESVVFNKIEPFVDQVIKNTETLINSLSNEKISTDYSQYIVEADFGNSIGFDVKSNIIMILEQTIPNTKTYKVISPTRSGFSATNILTRDDLFEAKATESPVQSRKVSATAGIQNSINDANKNKTKLEQGIVVIEDTQEVSSSLQTPNKLPTYQQPTPINVSNIYGVPKESDKEKQKRISKELDEERAEDFNTRYNDSQLAIRRNFEIELKNIKDASRQPLPWYDVINPGIPKIKGSDGKYYLKIQ